jgi:hypothetical protein
MPVRRSRARRGIGDRWVPSVLRVTLVFVLVVGLAGLAFGTYIFSGHDLVGRSGPSVAVPLSPGAVGDGAGSSSAEGTAASAAADSSRPSDTPAPAASSVAAQTRATAASSAVSVSAAKNYVDHNSPSGTTPAQRLSAAGYIYTQMAENIAAGQATAADVMASWMNSAGHKATILNCALTELGVGYATGGTYGSYWAQDFGTR